MSVATVMIVLGLLGVFGSLMALAMGWAIARSEAKEREWWDRRKTDWEEK